MLRSAAATPASPAQPASGDAGSNRASQACGGDGIGFKHSCSTSQAPQGGDVAASNAQAAGRESWPERRGSSCSIRAAVGREGAGGPALPSPTRRRREGEDPPSRAHRY
ncbi:hypothetical protein L7F22_062510 [Adiantum nelumboides]|nr:hypothetical protein [Adiantum nelumboides]